jgi:hypothetical protein
MPSGRRFQVIFLQPQPVWEQPIAGELIDQFPLLGPAT